MRQWRLAVVPLALVVAAFTHAQQPKNGDEPKPGTRGIPDNVPYSGKSDPKGNPVRLARATGHVSNDSEDKVPADTLPDPLVLAREWNYYCDATMVSFTRGTRVWRRS